MNDDNYDKELRKLGYVDSGRSGSRGDYFIVSYKPSFARQHRLPKGLVEIHICRTLNVYEIKTSLGTFSTLQSAVDALKGAKQ